MKNYAVIGLGRFGTSLAINISRLGGDVLAIDINPDEVQAIAPYVDHAVAADASDEAAIRAIGVKNSDVAIVALADNIERSVMITVLLKELGVPYVVAKAKSRLHGRVLEKVGADLVVYPESDMGERIAYKLTKKNMVDYIDLTDDCSVREINVPVNWENKSIKELDVRAKYGISIIAVKTGESINVSPGPDCVLKPGDLIVAVGENNRFDKIS